MLQTNECTTNKRQKTPMDYAQNLNVTVPGWMLNEIEKMALNTGNNRSQIIKQGLLRGLGLQRPTDQ